MNPQRNALTWSSPRFSTPSGKIFLPSLCSHQKGSSSAFQTGPALRAQAQAHMMPLPNAVPGTATPNANPSIQLLLLLLTCHLFRACTTWRHPAMVCQHLSCFLCCISHNSQPLLACVLTCFLSISLSYKFTTISVRKECVNLPTCFQSSTKIRFQNKKTCKMKTSEPKIPASHSQGREMWVALCVSRTCTQLAVWFLGWRAQTGSKTPYVAKHI